MLLTDYLPHSHVFSRTSRFQNLTDLGRFLTGLAPLIRIEGYQPSFYIFLKFTISNCTCVSFSEMFLCRHMTKYQSQYGAGGTQYSYYYEEDDSTFQLVRT